MANKKTAPAAGRQKETYIIKWTNVFSHETGYVGRIRAKYFENSYEASGARVFRSARAAENGIAKL